MFLGLEELRDMRLGRRWSGVWEHILGDERDGDEKGACQEDGGGEVGFRFILVELRGVKIDEHDDKSEEDHNGACVDEDLDNGNKRSMEEDIDSGDGQERSDESKGCIDWIGNQNNHQRKNDGKKSKDKEEGIGGEDEWDELFNHSKL